ncbi:MAG: hypothetical protein Q9179_007024 [Wetmoreana sp. 5 TL-2023]
MKYASTGHKTPRGLDDGKIPSKNTKKRKRDAVDTEAERQVEDTMKPAVPKILPGEHMADFAARVDLSLPVAGLVNRGKGVGKGAEGVKERQSRMEKRMQRMQKEWREAEARRKAKLADAREDAQEEDDFDDQGGINSGAGVIVKSKRKSKRRKNRRGEGGESENEDLWAVVAANRKREQEEKENRTVGLVGLHDVVQAPPKFSKLPKVKMDVVKKGGLKKQAELSEARRQVVEGYRQMMKERRNEVIAQA